MPQEINKNTRIDEYYRADRQCSRSLYSWRPFKKIKKKGKGKRRLFEMQGQTEQLQIYFKQYKPGVQYSKETYIKHRQDIKHINNFKVEST